MVFKGKAGHSPCRGLRIHCAGALRGYRGGTGGPGLSPLVKKAGQGRFAREIDGGEVKMVLADCTEDNVELEEVQRVMGGGRSTEPDIGGGTANAKEWIFSKGETRWFMRHPKLEYDDSIARWR